MRLCPRVLSLWWTAGDGGLPACPTAAPLQGLVPCLHKWAASVGSAQTKLGQSRGAGQGRELCLEGRSDLVTHWHLLVTPNQDLWHLSSFTDNAELNYLTLVFLAEGEQSLLVSVHTVNKRPLHSILSAFFKKILLHFCAFCCWFCCIKWPKSIVLKCSAEALSTLKCALWRE